MNIDWTGIALVIGAITVFITSVGGFVLSVLALYQGRATHDLVNGMTKSRDKLIDEKARREGGDAERKKPTKKK